MSVRGFDSLTRRAPTHRGLALAGLLLVAAACGGEATPPAPHDAGVDAADARDDSDLPPDTVAPDGGNADLDSDALPDAAADTVAPDAPDDPSDPTACPDPPADLPPVTVVGDGRLRSLGAIGRAPLREREVRVYLPPDYDATPERRYPVLYLHDGQNLFDPREAAFGQAWHVDRALDRLTAEGLVEPWLVVALHNTPDRVEEYTPGGLGEDYLAFLIERVKPLVDSHFRTLCGRQHTALAGSSLGGLISLEGALRHPAVFGRIGAVSPSLWWDDRELLGRAQHHDGPWPRRLWLDGGTAEGAEPGAPGLVSMVANLRDLRDHLLGAEVVLGEQLGYLEVLEGRHDEAAWAERLETILAFLLSDEAWPPDEATRLSAWPVAGALRPPSEATSLLVDARFGDHRRLTLPNQWLTLLAEPAGVVHLERDGWLTPLAPGSASLEASWGGLRSTAGLAVLAEHQSALTFQVAVPAATPAGEVIYVATDFLTPESWSPAALPLRHLRDRQWRGQIVGETGAAIDYKITRGSWETVEKDSLGGEIANRQATLQDGRAVVSVARWADDPEE